MGMTLDTASKEACANETRQACKRPQLGAWQQMNVSKQEGFFSILEFSLRDKRKSESRKYRLETILSAKRVTRGIVAQAVAVQGAGRRGGPGSLWP